ncbi:Uncharacterised protein [Paenibacillus macerans]|nr:hypothetical protein PbDSM24746_38400 [Paenibacillus macerans]GBK70149.1 hypothetical protein PbJCM17693_38570 [Paenibacillus macerans]GIP09593.1 hypothetical protein J1TS5_17630 [Paenibacillus macerans]SUA84107.1 Uncharacterised protein [Paenibacillus macerans]
MVKDAGLEIADARFIDFRRIEIYWNAAMEGAHDPQNFIVDLDGARLPGIRPYPSRYFWRTQR